MSITIADEWLVLIKKVLAYPSTDKIILTDTEIKDLCIYPAMHEYFTKFPLKENYTAQVSANNSVQVDFPDAYTFGLLDIRVTNKGYLGGVSPGFWDMVRFERLGYTSKNGYNGKYGTRYSFNGSGRGQQDMNKLVNDTIINRATVVFDVDQKEGTVDVYSDVSGDLNIIWAKWSDDFADITYEKKLDVVQLSQAYLLQQLADTMGIIDDSGLELSIDSDKLEEKAEKLREAIIEKWEDHTDVILMRS